MTNNFCQRMVWKCAEHDCPVKVGWHHCLHFMLECQFYCLVVHVYIQINSMEVWQYLRIFDTYPNRLGSLNEIWQDHDIPTVAYG